MATKPKTETIKRIVEFVGDASNFNATLKGIQAAAASSASSLKTMDRNIHTVTTSVKGFQAQMNTASAALKGFGTVFVATEIVRYAAGLVNLAASVVKASDQLTLMKTRLDRLGDGTTVTNFATAINLADKLGTSVTDLADQIALLAPAFQKMGLSFNQTAGFTEDMITAMRVFGTDARRAQIVTVQLAQALSSGKFQGDELRSLSENAGGLALELEKAVQQILGTKLSLRELGTAGQLSAGLVMQAFQEVFKNLEDDVKKLPKTFEQNLSRMENAWLRVKDAIERALAASDKFKAVMKYITDTMNDWAGASGGGFLTAGATDDTLVRLLEETNKEIYTTRENITNLTKVVDDYNASNAASKAVLDWTGIHANAVRQLAEEQTKLNGLLLKRNSMNVVQGQRAEAAATESNVKVLKDYGDIIDSVASKLKMTAAGKENFARIFPTIAEEAHKAGLQVSTVIAKMRLESVNFTKFSTSASSATGPGQIIESTAKYLAGKYKLNYELIRSGADDWKENAKAAILYLREKMGESEGDLTEALSRYFLGSGTVNAKGIDVTAGKNNGLTGRQYASKIIDTQRSVVEALRGSEFAWQGNEDALMSHLDTAEAALKTDEQYAAALTTFQSRVAELNKQFETGNLSWEAYGNAMAKAVQAYNEADPATQKLLKAQELTTEQTLQAADAYAELLAKYDPLIAAQQEYAAAVLEIEQATGQLNISEEKKLELLEKAKLAYEKNVKAAKEAAGGIEALSANLQDSAFSEFESWIDSAVEGTFKLEDAMQSLLKELTKLIAKYAIFKLLQSTVGGGISFGGFSTQATGNQFSGGTGLPQGVYTSPTFFKFAKGDQIGPINRFAKGGNLGVLGEAGPEAIMPMRAGGIRALMGGREMALPLARTASGHLAVNLAGYARPFAYGGVVGGASSGSMSVDATKPININVVNNAAADGYQTTTTQDAQGNIDIIIEKLINDINRGGNKTSRAFESAYRLNRAR